VPTNQPAFEAATTAFDNAIRGNILAIADAPEMIGHPLPPDFNFTGFPLYDAAKLLYVNELTASLAEIDRFQAQGIAHYNPAFLVQVHAFLGSVMGAELDTVATQPTLLAQVEMYGNLYNTGTWTNIITLLRQRQTNAYCATFLGWFRGGGLNNHQNLSMSLQVSFTTGAQSQSQTLQVGVYWSLALLKNAVGDLDANPPAWLHSYTITGPTGAVLGPDSQDLLDLGLKDGDQISATLVGSQIFGGPGVFPGPGILDPGNPGT
jgi:hypothetical protein